MLDVAMIDTDRRLFAFDNTYVQALPELVAEWSAADVPEPELVVLNTELAATLTDHPGRLSEPAGVAVLAGNEVPDGAAPVAMVYAGHQFGHYSPRLGDGRALLLGEIIDATGQRVDLHLKGSGRTPFARGGDGKATIGPMLREYLIAEAMHGLTIPTSRALAVVTTGEPIMRQRPEPGAVLTRVANSHLRVGTFEYAVRLEDGTVLRRLADYAIERHFPHLNRQGDAGHLNESEGRYLALLGEVVEVQASLVARWMLVGFIHGVMNTDNMTISGDTIDYGPCAFMDRYHSATVYSSIDHQGRYAYGNQPAIAQWNLTRLAETLLPLMADEAGVEPESMVPAATEILEGFTERLRANWAEGMRMKLGLANESDTDSQLFSGLLELLQTERLDYTSFFRRLARSLQTEGAPGDDDGLISLVEHQDRLESWLSSWRSRLEGEGRALADVAEQMDAVNPVYVPRNHLVEEALSAAQNGDLEPFDQLLAVVTDPFTERPGLERYAQPAPDEFNRGFQTFCGT